MDRRPHPQQQRDRPQHVLVEHHNQQREEQSREDDRPRDFERERKPREESHQQSRPQDVVTLAVDHQREENERQTGDQHQLEPDPAESPCPPFQQAVDQLDQP